MTPEGFEPSTHRPKRCRISVSTRGQIIFKDTTKLIRYGIIIPVAIRSEHNLHSRNNKPNLIIPCILHMPMLDGQEINRVPVEIQMVQETLHNALLLVVVVFCIRCNTQHYRNSDLWHTKDLNTLPNKLYR